MGTYQANITLENGEFYALIVRLENNGRGGVEKVVITGYKGRHFKTKNAAEKSTGAYIAKISK